MEFDFKKGGGGKLQPYITAGNGAKSGEYTEKTSISSESEKSNKAREFKPIINVKLGYNFCKSSLVKTVTKVRVAGLGVRLPITHRKNSVIKKIVNNYVISERYFDENGDVYLDIDYTCHYNKKTHPLVPHVHKWFKNGDGQLRRKKGEKFE